VVGLPGLGSGPLDIVVRTAVVYAFVVLGLRLGGKREVGQLSIIDLVALLLLSNAVQNAMVGEDTSLAGGLLAAAVIIGMARGLDILIRRSRTARAIVIGMPRVLISNGAVIEQALHEEEVSPDELDEALREHGLEDPRDVKAAILEADGSISIIPMPAAADRFQGGSGSDTKARRAGRIPRRTEGGRRDSAAPTDPDPKQ
jgi:uncharacterized membrane protein YcaP (DUF421 family)